MGMFRDNPVLSRELLVNLRSHKAFVLQFIYALILAVAVLIAWPQTTGSQLGASVAAARQLFDLFFFGQFLLVALLAPTFAAGSITGEKERKTYELLLASPLRPSWIVVGKLFSSLTYLIILLTSSLPMMILGYLLGGILLSEVARAYLVLVLAAGTFGLISVACSSYFSRTSSALVVSYLVILPVAILGAYMARTDNLVLRNFFTAAILPPWTIVTWLLVIAAINFRLLRPPDVGSEGKDVVDEKEEQKYAIGVVIDRDLFPDKLFAPAKRTDLMPDRTNPVLDKELRSEIFSQGTLMLRVVIQVSMFLSIPLMAVFLFWRTMPGYYVCYVLTFNLLVGPVFSSGSITQERERQTISLLLTTLLTPSRIVMAKLLAALRVSTVLTLLLTEQIILAYALVRDLQLQFLSIIPYFLIILTTCLLTSSIGLMWSSLVRRTSVAMIMTYLSLMVVFVLPLGIYQWSLSIFPEVSKDTLRWSMTPSPFAASMSVPIVGDRLTASGSDIQPIERPLNYLGFPMWVAFVPISLVMSMICHAVALLAFRLLWWRARESV